MLTSSYLRKYVDLFYDSSARLNSDRYSLSPLIEDSIFLIIYRQ